MDATLTAEDAKRQLAQVRSARLQIESRLSYFQLQLLELDQQLVHFNVSHSPRQGWLGRRHERRLAENRKRTLEALKEMRRALLNLAESRDEIQAVEQRLAAQQATHEAQELEARASFRPGPRVRVSALA